MMGATLTCPRGHRWQAADADLTTEGPLCPVCGEASSGATSVAEAATLPWEAGAGPSLPACPGGLVGRTVGHYRVEARLGAGGMGEVYLARDLALGRDAALKVLPAGFSSSLQARLLREAWAGARLQHPGIATYYESGEDAGVDFIAMEYVPGRTLREVLGAGPLPADRALAVADAVLKALAHAHAAGILHRDIKPENIMVGEDGSAKLLDFGLAKTVRSEPQDPRPTLGCDLRSAATDDAVAAGAEEQSDGCRGDGATARPPGPTILTGAGAITGTAGYIAPELLAGRPADVRSDLFAVGAVLYEAVAGCRAFPGATVADRIHATLHRDPPPLCAPELDAIVSRALDRDPARRHASAGAFLAELRRHGPSEEEAASPEALAILDFAALDGHGDDWIGGGIVEGLLVQLSRVPGLALVPREVATRARSAVPGSDREVGLYLRCRWLVSGAHRRVGPALHVSARLTDVASGQMLADERLDGPTGDLPPMLDRLAGAIIGHLDLGGPTPAAPGAAASRLEAHRCYSHGRRLWLEHGTKGSFDESRELFEQALGHDPAYVPALVGLAQLHAFRFNFTTEPEALEAGAGFARRAVEAGPYAYEPHAWLGYILTLQGRPVEGYEEERRAMELEPTHSQPPYFAAWALEWASDPGDASRLHRRITGQPPPADLHLWRRGEALALLQRAVALNPRHSWSWLATGCVHLELGHLREARWCMERAVRLEGTALTSFPGAAGYLGECLRRTGELAEARRQCLAGLAVAERTDSMYRDTCRGIYLCTLGRTALQQGDVDAARAAYRQAVLHVRGRPRARCGGNLIAQALAGMAEAGEGGEPLEEAVRLFERREGWNFGWFYGCSEEMTLMALARAALALGRDEEARRFLERARAAGCTERGPDESPLVAAP